MSDLRTDAMGSNAYEQAHRETFLAAYTPNLPHSDAQPAERAVQAALWAEGV